MLNLIEVRKKLTEQLNNDIANNEFRIKFSETVISVMGRYEGRQVTKRIEKVLAQELTKAGIPARNTTEEKDKEKWFLYLNKEHGTINLNKWTAIENQLHNISIASYISPVWDPYHMPEHVRSNNDGLIRNLQESINQAKKGLTEMDTIIKLIEQREQIRDVHADVQAMVSEYGLDYHINKLCGKMEFVAR